MNVSDPLYLLLIPLLFALTVLMAKKYRQRGKTVLAVRLFLFALLGVAFAQPFAQQLAARTTTIFAVDLSASMKGTENETTAFLNDALSYPTNQDHVGVVGFGKKAQVERGVADALQDVAFHVNVAKGFTNIADALHQSASLLPENEKKRIVLLSDGNENVDAALDTIQNMKSQGIRVDVLPIENKIGQEVQLSSINVPSHISKNMSYDIAIAIDSLVDTKTKLIVYKGNHIISNQEVTVRTGENKFVVEDTATEGGGIVYRAEIQPETDVLYENNSVYGYTYIEDTPRLLVLENQNSAYKIKDILENSLVNITVLNSKAAPTEPEQLNLYDAVILADVSIDDLPPTFPDVLEGYVKNSGGGVLVTGGEHAYALGDYFDTKLETILPVEMRMKENKKKPDLSMVIVLDRSGSMASGQYGVSKLELAKESSIRAADIMDDKDSFGVLAFDEASAWISPLQPVLGNKKNIADQIASISIGGGTSILPALKEAFSALSARDSKLKHIILLTDGQAEQTGYNAIVQSMNESGVTLSTIAVGTDADRALLSSLAEKGGGRYYYTDEFTDLPKIFARETVMAGDSYINNRTFYPTVSDATPIVAGIEQLPSLDGYIATTAKDRADVVLVSDKDDPIVATWQYGLGRTVAFTSDVDKWTTGFFASDEGVKMFRNMVSWALRKQMETDVNVSIVAGADKSDISVTLPYSETITGMHAVVSTGSKDYTVQFDAVAPNEYKAQIPDSTPGTYIVNLQIEKGAESSLVTRGVSVPYSKEYDIRQLANGRQLLQNLAESTGGIVLSAPDEVFKPIDANVRTKKEWTNVCLALALVLFLIDVAIRRFPSIIPKIQKACKRVAGRLIFWNHKKGIKYSKETVYNEKDIEITEEPVMIKEMDKKKLSGHEKESPDTSSLLVSKKRKRLGR